MAQGNGSVQVVQSLHRQHCDVTSPRWQQFPELQRLSSRHPVSFNVFFEATLRAKSELCLLDNSAGQDARLYVRRDA